MCIKAIVDWFNKIFNPPVEPPPPDPEPTKNKDVIVVRDPKCQGFQVDHISTVNFYPVMVPAVKPGTDNKQFFLYGYRINVFTESNQYQLNRDGALRDKDGYWYYQIRNATFTSGMSAALYFVRYDHVRDA